MNWRLIGAGILLAAFLCACGGTSTAATNPTVSASAAVGAAASPVAPVACSGTITTPSTPAKSSLTQTYDTSHAPFDPAKVAGLAPGSVNAWWFMGKGGTYVVWFAGLCNANAPVCPGASLQVGSAYQDISNSPTASGGCAGDTKYLAASPAVQICNRAFVFYVTTIPNTASGNLIASVEKGQPDGTTIVGLTSAVATSAVIPAIDLSTLGCVAPS